MSCVDRKFFRYSWSKKTYLDIKVLHIFFRTRLEKIDSVMTNKRKTKGTSSLKGGLKTAETAIKAADRPELTSITIFFY